MPAACSWQHCLSLVSLTPSTRSVHAALLTRNLLRLPSPISAFNSLLRSLSNPFPLFRLMLRLSSPSPDHLTFPYIILSLSSLPSALQLHALALKNGLANADHFVQTALLRRYAPVHLPLARHLFDQIPRPDPVHFDVLMNAYLRNGSSLHALRLFNSMLDSGIQPDAHAVATALTACSHAGDLKLGIRIHKLLLVDDEKIKKDSHVVSALINMYSKCGCITEAVAVFDACMDRNAIMWAALVSGLAVHGLAREAVRCIGRMAEQDGLRPDGVVILGALTACAHAGLVEEGLTLLAEMAKKYGMAPQHEHYSCVVDMLCRVGRLEDAVVLIRRMPMKPMASVWGSLLAGCRIYGNMELAEVAVRELQGITLSTEEVGDDEGVYVQLSNIYRKANRLEDARRVRKMIGSGGGRKKVAAVSAIEVDGEVSSFVAGDPVHPRRVEIGRMLEVLMDDIGLRSRTVDFAVEEETGDWFCL